MKYFKIITASEASAITNRSTPKLLKDVCLAIEDAAANGRSGTTYHIAKSIFIKQYQIGKIHSVLERHGYAVKVLEWIDEITATESWSLDIKWQKEDPYYVPIEDLEEKSDEDA